MTSKRPEMTRIYYNPKTKSCVGLGDFGDDGLPRYAACWSLNLPLMPEEDVKKNPKVVNRNPNVNWDLVDEMFGPEDGWINRPNSVINWQQVWKEFDTWYKSTTQFKSISWEEQKTKIQEEVEKYSNVPKSSNLNFSDCIVCGKFMEHDHKCENM